MVNGDPISHACHILVCCEWLIVGRLLVLDGVMMKNLAKRRGGGVKVNGIRLVEFPMLDSARGMSCFYYRLLSKGSPLSFIIGGTVLYLCNTATLPLPSQALMHQQSST